MRAYAVNGRKVPRSRHLPYENARECPVWLAAPQHVNNGPYQNFDFGAAKVCSEPKAADVADCTNSSFHKLGGHSLVDDKIHLGLCAFVGSVLT